MLIVRPPSLLTRALRRMTWDFYGDHRNVYLTFDDGPTPVITPWVLDRLGEADALATFFCLGRNVDKYPEIYRQILSRGHTVGNHSYSHLKGFRSTVGRYMDDINLAGNLIDSKLFRPPYGRIFPGQVKAVLEEYDIIMWDVLSIDYNTGLTGERVLQNVTNNVKPGSIIVFHDSEKASENLFFALPRTLEYLSDHGYRMLPIPSEGLPGRDHTIN
ncbi:MAG TPA: polysaccharide deacetylase family protein [Bacteroides sp.]|nr:polysaccharide deacetylase family protein [Bacteroides sp.]